MAFALNQGAFGTCVAHAFAVALWYNVREKYGIALSLNRLLGVVLANLPASAWNGDGLRDAVQRWNQRGRYVFDTDNKRYYRVRVTYRRLDGIEAAYAEAKRVNGRMLILACITVRGGSHAVAIDRVLTAGFQMRTCNSWGSTEPHLLVTKDNFKYAYTIETHIDGLLTLTRSYLDGCMVRSDAELLDGQQVLFQNDFTAGYLTADSTKDGGDVYMEGTIASSSLFRLERDDNGTWAIKAHGGKNLNVAGGGTANGTRVQVWGTWTGGHNAWELQSRGDGLFWIRSVCSGRFLNVCGGATADGTPVHTWEATDNGHNDWHVIVWPEKTASEE
jgi:hypothetical protein